MKRWIFTLVPLVLLGSLITWRLLQHQTQSGNQNRQRDARRMPASVELATAQVRDLVNTYEATGTVESLFDVKISPKTSGRILAPRGRGDLVREGASVKAGEVLFVLDASDIEAQVHQQEASLAEARYRYEQAKLAQTPADTAVQTQILQQTAAVASAEADLEQAQKNAEAQAAAANANVVDAQQRIESATANMANARAAISSAEASRENALAKYDRIHGLYKQGYIAAQDVDDAKTTVSVQTNLVEAANGQLKTATAAFNSAVAQKKATEEQVKIVLTKGKTDIAAAQAKLQQAKAALQYARANSQQTPAYQQSLAALQAGVEAARASLDGARSKLADTTIRSPINGVVTERYLDPGDIASPSQPVIAIQALRQVWVTVAVPEEVCVKLQIGQTAMVRFDAYPGQAFPTSIAQIHPTATVQSRKFTVRLVLDNSQNQFKPGMFARVALETERIRNAVVVPREAIQQDEDGMSFVMGVAADNTALRCPVTAGASDANGTVILSGVSAGDKVVVLSSFPLRDGQPIRVNDGREERRRNGEGASGGPGSMERRGRGQQDGGAGEPGKPDASPSRMPGGRMERPRNSGRD